MAEHRKKRRVGGGGEEIYKLPYLKAKAIGLELRLGA